MSTDDSQPSSADGVLIAEPTDAQPQTDETSPSEAVGGIMIQAPEALEEPAKVLRIGNMIKQLLEEVRHAPLDDASRARMRDVYEISIKELANGLSEDLRDELARMTSPFTADSPSDAELRVAHAQLVGWLEGLFHGIQATLFAQQMAARAQLEEMRRRGLPAPAEEAQGARPRSTYL